MYKRGIYECFFLDFFSCSEFNCFSLCHLIFQRFLTTLLSSLLRSSAFTESLTSNQEASANMVSTYIIISAVIAFVAVALGAAYTTGALDPVIEQMGIMFFKAKAEAEKKKLQAQGMKEGEDFMDGELFLSVSM